MGDVVESATIILTQAARRAEISAQNLANAATPGYKRKIGFSSFIAAGNDIGSPVPSIVELTDFAIGKVVETGNAQDLSIAGSGYFSLRSGDILVYTRHGQFSRDRDGRLVNARGLALQLTSGADLVLKGGTFTVGADGTVRDDGAEIGRIAVFRPAREVDMQPVEGGFRAASEALEIDDQPLVRQGALEASNVSTGDEMVAMMEALRRAESGQRIMNVYDDLMGRVLTSFAEGVR